jgi:hypothetical protein
MSKQLSRIKKTKQLYILSDCSSYYDYTISLKTQSSYTLFSQDFNNHFFWIDSIKQVNLSDNLALLKFRNRYL